MRTGGIRQMVGIIYNSRMSAIIPPVLAVLPLFEQQYPATAASAAAPPFQSMLIIPRSRAERKSKHLRRARQGELRQRRKRRCPGVRPRRAVPLSPQMSFICVHFPCAGEQCSPLRDNHVQVVNKRCAESSHAYGIPLLQYQNGETHGKRITYSNQPIRIFSTRFIAKYNHTAGRGATTLLLTPTS